MKADMNLIIYVDNLVEIFVDIKKFYKQINKKSTLFKNNKIDKKSLLSILNEYLAKENDDYLLQNEFFTFKDDIKDIDINRKDKIVYIKKKDNFNNKFKFI